MAHCNRVQKLFFSFFFFKLLLLFLFFLSSNDPPQRAAAAADPPSPFTEKPEPNTGCCRPQKTNALQPLLDRYETPTVLEKLETLPKTNCQTASASLEKGGVWPAKAAMSVPSRHAEFGSFRPLLGTKKVSFLAQMGANSQLRKMKREKTVPTEDRRWDVGAAGQKWSPSGSKLASAFLKRLQLWKSTAEKRRRRAADRPAALLLLSKWPYNIHAN